jgi:diguanylate cyclase
MERTALRNTPPPERARVFCGYVAVVCLLGLALAAPYLAGLAGFLRHAPVAFWLMAVLAMLSDARPFTPSGGRPLSPVFPSVCFSFAALVSWGVGPAVLVATAAVAVSAVRLGHRPWRLAFNAAQYALAFVAAGPWLAGHPGGVAGALRTFAAAASWFAVNYCLVAGAVWLRFGGGWWWLLRRTAPYEALSTGALLLLGPVLSAAAYRSPALIPFVLVPLYAVSRMARLSRDQERLARLDPLTGLLGRKGLESELVEQVTAHAEAGSRTHEDTLARVRAAAGPGGGGRFGLLLLDLDRFKHVNDALGHGVGDRLLVAVAERLAGAVRPPNLVARLGGDEFAVVLPALRDLAEAYARAVQLSHTLVEPVVLDGLPLDVGGSIGVAVYPDHGTDVATLLSHADVAMYDAKARGDAVALYAPDSDHNSPQRLSLLADLRRALDAPESTEIAFFYQPQVDIESGEVIGVEALLRWHHPELGPIDPEELIRVAEHSAVMRLLTLRVIDDVVAQLGIWAEAGVLMRASLNVSVRDLHTTEVVDRLAERLREHGVVPDQIQLEITEGALMADPRRVLNTLRRLDQLGVALSLDDFGTGYSSLQHLRRLPLAEVKIDRSFVLGMASDPDDEAIVRSIIELARALGLRVVAEGVEDARTLRLLEVSGCHAAQGWFYGHPMPAGEVVPWLSRYRPPQRPRPARPPAPAFGSGT